MLRLNSSAYIDCYTTIKERTRIFNLYKTGQLAFLVNVKLLIEGFDAPITKGVCLLHLPASKTIIIQIIGRALRLHPYKKIANIILPYSTADDQKGIKQFMKVLTKNDDRLKLSFNNKILGGYINISKQIVDNNEEEILDVEFKYELIYNSIGEFLSFKINWIQNFEKMKTHLQKYNRLPSKQDFGNKEIKKLLGWIDHNKVAYKDKKMHPEIYEMWHNFITSEPYDLLFLTNVQKWYNKFDKFKNFIDTYSKIPQQADNKTNNVDEKEAKLARWRHHQMKSYKKTENIMKHKIIYDVWKNFITSEKYSLYFEHYLKDHKAIWLVNFEKLKKYIKLHGSIPQKDINDPEIFELSEWTRTQRYRKFMRCDDEIKIIWNNFINDPEYSELFIKNDVKWIRNLDTVKKFFDENNDITLLDAYLIDWIVRQKANLNAGIKSVSNDPNINKLWIDFANDEKYKKYL